MERTGFVYLAQCNIYHKIGFSVSPVERMKSIQTDNPEKIKLIAAIPGTRQDEKRWHQVFVAKRIHHEWFNLDDADLATFITTPGCIEGSTFEHKGREVKAARAELGEFLRAQRMRQGRTLREVSNSSGISLGYISEIERGQKEVSSRFLQLICETLDVQVGEVYQSIWDAGTD